MKRWHWSLFSFFFYSSSYSASQSSHQICQENYPLRGWKSMKFQIQSQSDKMSLLAYLAWIEHSSGGALNAPRPLSDLRAYLCTKGPLNLRGSPFTDNLSMPLHTKSNVSHFQKEKYSQSDLLILCLCFVHPNLFSDVMCLLWNIRLENSNTIGGCASINSCFSENHNHLF